MIKSHSKLEIEIDSKVYTERQMIQHSCKNIEEQSWMTDTNFKIYYKATVPETLYW